MKQRILIAFGVLAVSICSCKKTTPSSQNCQLAALVDSTTSVQAVTLFTYDAQNRLTSVVVSGDKGCKRTYQYIGNTIVFTVTDTTQGIFTETDTLVLNSLGLIQTQAAYYPTAGTSQLETFIYDDAGNALRSVESENGDPGDTMEYYTTNGDLNYETEKGASVHKTDFSYYPSRSIVFGDPTDFRQLLYYGAYYYKNKHMLSVLSSPGKSYKSYAYTFSGTRIAQATMRQWTNSSPDTVTHTLTYTYSCK